MSRSDVLGDLGPIDEWLISPEEIEKAAAGLCEHLVSVWDCQPCLMARLLLRQWEIIGTRWGLNPEDAAELARRTIRPAAGGGER